MSDTIDRVDVIITIKVSNNNFIFQNSICSTYLCMVDILYKPLLNAPIENLVNKQVTRNMIRYYKKKKVKQKNIVKNVMHIYY